MRLVLFFGNDIYSQSRIYKRGANFRVDTTLVGFENMKWSRGDLSFVFKGEEAGGILSCFHLITGVTLSQV